MHAWTTLQKGYAMQRDASDTRVNPDLILKAIEKDEVLTGNAFIRAKETTDLTAGRK